LLMPSQLCWTVPVPPTHRPEETPAAPRAGVFFSENGGQMTDDGTKLFLYFVVRHLSSDNPYRPVGVFAHQQRAVVRDRDPDRPAPHRAVVDGEAGEEILIFAGGHAVFELDADDLIPGPLRPVPRAVLGRECIAVILGGELRTGVEGELQRSGVRLNQHVRNGDLVLELGAIAAVLR